MGKTEFRSNQTDILKGKPLGGGKAGAKTTGRGNQHSSAIDQEMSP